MKKENCTYKQYAESLANSTLDKMMEERKRKLLNPHLLRNRDETERELDIIIDVLNKRGKKNEAKN